MFHVLVPAPQFKLHPEMVEQTCSPCPFALGVPKLHCYCLKRIANPCSSSRMPHMVWVTSLQSARHNQSLVLRHRHKSAHRATTLPAGAPAALSFSCSPVAASQSSHLCLCSSIWSYLLGTDEGCLNSQDCFHTGISKRLFPTVVQPMLMHGRCKFSTAQKDPAQCVCKQLKAGHVSTTQSCLPNCGLSFVTKIHTFSSAADIKLWSHLFWD